ncbi:MAG TPA: hypothetical protein VL651_02350 [Bacteroidia bacterium]|jgi:hypothetical protein|nr:hypothetical protein [Bacteroidia bacterium]
MKKIVSFLLLNFLITTFIYAQPQFHLTVRKKKSDEVFRSAQFIPAATIRERKNVKRSDPGSCGHLTILSSDEIDIAGDNDSVEKLLALPGNYVFSFENPESMDSMPYISLVKDSSSEFSFINKVKRIRKREWEVYRIVVTDKHSGASYCVYLRFEDDLFTLNLPNKSNRETMKFSSISPALPIIHIGNIDYTHYQVGPGISFNVGLMPRKPYLRLLSDIVGPVSAEWMFKPIGSLNDALAIQSSAVGVFFNSFYGLFHWGIAWYTLDYSRAEAYIGINFSPAMQLFNSRKSWRYRW